MSELSLNDLLFRSSLIGDIVNEVDASDRIIYMGLADAGSDTGDPKWRIIKFTYTGTNVTFDTMKYADGSTDANKIWTNRANYQY